jgi:hypothetical protein
MVDVGLGFPAEIPQVPFDGQARKIVEQDFGRRCRFLGSSPWTRLVEAGSKLPVDGVRRLVATGRTGPDGGA